MTNLPRLPIVVALCVIYAVFFSSCSRSQGSAIVVTNDVDFDRFDEIAELSTVPNLLADTAGEYVLVDSEGMPVPTQVTYDGKLIFPASVKAQGASTYNIIKRTELAPEILKSSNAYVFDSNIAYTVRSDCQDDFAWENEHSGYRLYGPSFKRGGGMVHGYDIWCKRNPAPIVDRFYNLDHGPEKITYHKDHGEGFDGYTVGPTLGAGANALLADSAICYPTAYDAYEVLDNGPLRLTVRFTIDSIPFGRDSNGNQRYVSEIRTVSLDRLSHFNKSTSTYTGVDAPTPIVAGIAVHADNPNGYALMDSAHALAVTDLSDDVAAGNGEIYIGAIIPAADSLYYSPFEELKANAAGQVLAKAAYTPGIPFTYYWGSGWSKATVPDAAQWQSIIKQKSQTAAHPLSAKLLSE